MIQYTGEPSEEGEVVEEEEGSEAFFGGADARGFFHRGASGGERVSVCVCVCPYINVVYIIYLMPHRPGQMAMPYTSTHPSTPCHTHIIGDVEPQEGGAGGGGGADPQDPRPRHRPRLHP